MDSILAPAIKYAKEEFPVTPFIAHYWDIRARILSDQPGPSKKNLHRLHTGSTQPTDSLPAHL